MRGNLQGSNLVVEESPHSKPVQRLITSAADAAVVHVSGHSHTQSFFASPEQMRGMSFSSPSSTTTDLPPPPPPPSVRSAKETTKRERTHLAWRTTTRFGAPFSQESSSLHRAHNLSKLGARP